MVLNPPDSSIILDRHSLILLADKSDDIKPLSPAAAARARAHHQQQQQQAAANSAAKASAKSAAQKAAAATIAGSRGAGAEAAVWGEWSEAAAGVPIKVVVLAFDGQSPEDLLEALADYCPAGSQVRVCVGWGGGSVVRSVCVGGRARW